MGSDLVVGHGSGRPLSEAEIVKHNTEMVFRVEVD